MTSPAGSAQDHDEQLARALVAAASANWPEAGELAARLLAKDPDDIGALEIAGRAALRGPRPSDAAGYFSRAAALYPDYTEAHFQLAFAEAQQERFPDAARHLEPLLAMEPDDINLMKLGAAIFDKAGRYEEAAQLLARLLEHEQGDAKLWTHYGHALRTLGRRDECMAAYRRALELAPGTGDAWWSIANLKTAALTDQDLAAMKAILAGDVAPDERARIEFAVARALEERGLGEESFAHYSEANRLRRETLSYDPEEITAYVDRAREVFTQDFFEQRQGGGAQDRAPIFIVGMPRSGSTLVEQILSGHSEIEAAGELPDLLAIARALRQQAEAKGQSYPEALALLDEGERTRLGEEYLERTRGRRFAGRPLFVDKTPNNWAHIGLIRLILPNAAIIDVRRHPLGCCVSNYKQYFADGQEFSYSLPDVGRYYRDYVRLMEHFTAVLPQALFSLSYEKLVEDPEREIRALLAHLQLDFQPACLDLSANQRPVNTPSSEQVRRPIGPEGTDNWVPFEPWIEPLKEALGPDLQY